MAKKKAAPKTAKKKTGKNASAKRKPAAKAAPKKTAKKAAAAKKKAAPAAKKKAAPAAKKKAAPAAKKKAAPAAKKKVVAKVKATPNAKSSAMKSAPKKAPMPKKAPPDDAPTTSGLNVGDAVPAFSLPDQHGQVISSESLAGKPYVLYFYPKDDTPGCTKEACAFRDDVGKFGAVGATIVGVSPDGEKSHARFAEKYGLPFTLLSDEEKTLAKAFGVWVMKQNYGREYMGIERSTFVIDAEGKVKKVFRRVRVDGHSDAVLAAL